MVAGGSEIGFVTSCVGPVPLLVAGLLLAYTAPVSPLERPTVDQSVCFGEPCVRGTRITVGDVLSYLAAGMTKQQIVAEFSQLTREGVRVCQARAEPCAAISARADASEVQRLGKVLVIRTTP